MSSVDTTGDVPTTKLRDLRHVDLTKGWQAGQDLRQSKLYGAKIALKCLQFDGTRVTDVQMALLLLMVALLEADSPWKDDLHALVAQKLGQARYARVAQYLRVAE